MAKWMVLALQLFFQLQSHTQIVLWSRKSPKMLVNFSLHGNYINKFDIVVIMEISSNYDLTGLNTFGVKEHAKLFVEVKSEEDLKELLHSTEFKENQRFFLGGGSNILFTKDFDGIVILNKLKGMEILEDNSEYT